MKIKLKPHATRKKAGKAKTVAKFVHHQVAGRPHEFLSRKSKAYRRYHDWRWHKHLHIGIASGYLVLVIVFLTNSLHG